MTNNKYKYLIIVITVFAAADNSGKMVTVQKHIKRMQTHYRRTHMYTYNLVGLHILFSNKVLNCHETGH